MQRYVYGHVFDVVEVEQVMICDAFNQIENAHPSISWPNSSSEDFGLIP